MASTTSPKVPVYSVSDLKNTTDDALMPYLTTLPEPYKFTINNSNSNVRLILGYSAVTIAGTAFYMERKLGWEVTQPWMLSVVLIYFTLNLALTIWIWAVEAGQIFEGTREGGEKLKIRSSSKRNSPIYSLRILHISSDGKVLQEKKAEAAFTRWFSGDGFFHPGSFRHWLDSEIDILGRAAAETILRIGKPQGGDEDGKSEPKKSSKGARKGKK